MPSLDESTEWWGVYTYVMDRWLIDMGESHNRWMEEYKKSEGHDPLHFVEFCIDGFRSILSLHLRGSITNASFPRWQKLERIGNELEGVVVIPVAHYEDNKLVMEFEFDRAVPLLEFMK